MKDWTTEQIREWRAGELAILKAMLPDFPKEEGEPQQEALADYEVLFRDASQISNKVVTVNEALRQLQEWLLITYVRPGQTAQEYLEVSICRTIGRETVTYTLGSRFDVSSGAGRAAYYDRLVDSINLEFGRYERDRAQNGNNPQASVGSGYASMGTVQVQAAHLSVEVKDGKKFFKVRCGQWQQHGVPFYAEHIKAGGVDPDEIPLVGWDLKNYDAVIQMDGDKPKRVLRLVKHPA